MFTAIPMMSQLLPTTSLSMAQATYEHKRPSIIRKKSGEIVKSSLKMAITNHEKENKSVRFPNSLARVRSFDKLQCPQSVSGFTPMSIRSLNFSNNDHLLEHMPVCLEKIEQDDNDIVGTVRVKNLGFQKKIVARYSFDNWATFSCARAYYVCSLTILGDQDQFEFNIEIPPHMRTSDREEHYCLKFAIQYLVNELEYWDNNQTKNYTLEINPAVEVNPVEANLYIPPSPENLFLANREMAIPVNNSKFGSRYNFNSQFAAASHNFASTSNLTTSVSTGYLPPPRSVRTVRLSQNPQGGLAAPVVDTTIQPISIPQPYSTSPSAGLSCSPISGFGWAKAQSSWFDTITLDDFKSSSPPVHSS